MRSPELRDSQWRDVRLIIQSIDRQIGEVYAERGVDGVPPRYSMALIRLHARGDLTIRQLAEEVEVTHSAMSQTVTSMRRDGLVRTIPGADARTRVVTLTQQGLELVPFLEAEWWATQAVLTELDTEAGGGFSEAAARLGEALRRRSFAGRLRDHLADASGPQHDDAAGH